MTVPSCRAERIVSEASTVTTILELMVGDDICKILVYNIADKNTRPWGHITCDGTVANIEASWAARNLKYYPLSLQLALKN